MANLKLEEKWIDGIYQLEVTDPVMGGEDGIDNLQAKQLGGNIFYLRKMGIAEWDANFTYSKFSLVNVDGVLYASIIDGNKNKKVSDTTAWKKVIVDVADASTTQKGVVKLNSAINSTSIVDAATPSAVKTAYDLANTANTTANTAKTNAATAQTKADSAYTLASTVNTTANTAKSTAETDASTTVKGRVQLNSAVNSTVENQAATPKAVKTAYDLANTALSRSGGGVVTGNTNYTGKLQQAGSDVITTETIKNYIGQSIVLYPSGSESSPPTLTVNQSIKIDNPFNTMNIICYVEIFNNNVWGRVHDTFYNFDSKVTLISGIFITPISNNQLSITTGASELFTGGLVRWVTGSLTSAKYRVRVIKIGD
ncbi:phage tail protein [Orbus mooreae]